MKINNPTKIASRRILIEKMNRYNTDEENRILEEQVEKHNLQTGDVLIFYSIKQFKITFDLEPRIDFKRGAIPEKYQPIYKR